MPSSWSPPAAAFNRSHPEATPGPCGRSSGCRGADGSQPGTCGPHGHQPALPAVPSLATQLPGHGKGRGAAGIREQRKQSCRFQRGDASSRVPKAPMGLAAWSPSAPVPPAAVWFCPGCILSAAFDVTPASPGCCFLYVSRQNCPQISSSASPQRTRSSPGPNFPHPRGYRPLTAGSHPSS